MRDGFVKTWALGVIPHAKLPEVIGCLASRIAHFNPTHHGRMRLKIKDTLLNENKRGRVLWVTPTYGEG